MDSTQTRDLLMTQLTAAQPRLYAFCLTLLGDPDQAHDVLQETNMVLWRKADQFEPGTNFPAWALRIARFQVMAHLQKKHRDRLRFDDRVLEQLAQRAESYGDNMDQQMRALHFCLDKLQPRQRRLIEQRYRQGLCIKTIAQQISRTVYATAQVLYRARTSLARCIEGQLVTEKQS